MLIEKRLNEIASLGDGSHYPNIGFCLMEAVAYVAGEEWSDNPACASPILAAFGRALNDALSYADRQELLPLIPWLVGSRSTWEIEQKRMYFLCDVAVRKFGPITLRVAGREREAVVLETIPPIVGNPSAEAAIVLVSMMRAARPKTDSIYAAIDELYFLVLSTCLADWTDVSKLSASSAAEAVSVSQPSIVMPQIIQAFKDAIALGNDK